MDMDGTRDRDVVDLLHKCAAQDHGMARLRDALGVGLESGWQQRCLAEVADMMEAELDDIGTLARARGEKLMEQDAMLASLLICLKSDYRIRAEWDGLRMVWTTEVDGDWCTARDDLVEELEAELEAEREEAAFWEGQHDAELNRRIKAEQRIGDMERTHIELPVDADGLPIRLWDVVAEEEFCPEGGTVVGMKTYRSIDHWLVNCGAWVDSRKCRHVKHDTVEGVVAEAMSFACEPESPYSVNSKHVREYAERIRKAVEHG